LLPSDWIPAFAGMTIERDIYNAMNRCSKTGIIGVFKNGTIAFIMQLSIVPNFFISCEEFLRSLLCPGWLELPIFDCRLLMDNGY